jgi:hypothetical protein
MSEDRIRTGLRKTGLAALLAVLPAPAVAQQAPVAPDAPGVTPDSEPAAAVEPAETVEEPAVSAPAGPVSPSAEAPAQGGLSLPESVPAGALDEAAPAAEPEELVERRPPAALEVGEHGFFEPGALLQFWLFGSHQDDETDTTFRVRRAELKVSGEIYPELVRYRVMIDPAKALEFDAVSLPVEGQEPEPDVPGEVTAEQPASGTSIFQDFEIGFLTPFADVTVGQFKVPLGFEGYNSSSKLLFPERALASKEYGDRRDIGLRVDKKIGPVYYYVGLFNGAGQNRLDTNDQKDLAARVEVSPLPGLMLGAAAYTSLGEREQPTTRDRVEADLRLEVANALLQAEYLHGWDGSNQVERVQGHGFYAALGYTFFGRLQPLVRVGFLDTDVERDVAAGGSDEVWHYEVGANYFIDGHRAKLQLSGSWFDYEDGPSRAAVILAAQASF